ncbi:MAG: glycosyltransferase family 2 protein, partial [Microcoleaceae cyanobacterium]
MTISHLINNLPLVSVIIPAYNAENFIARTLESVISQTYQNIEVLVINDGSQDQTVNIIESFAQKDSRIILLEQTNSGVAIARNLGITQAKGELIAPIDADDIWYAENLEKQVNCMIKADQSVGLVYAWSVDINENDQLTGGFHVAEYEGKVYLPLLYHNFIGNGSAVLIKKSCLEKIGGYNYEQLKDENSHGSEDWELYLRIAEYYEFAVVPEFLIGYRKSSLSTSYKDQSMDKFYQLVMQMSRQKYPEIPEKIYRWSGSNFYLYLAYQSVHAKKYVESLLWLKKSFSLDWQMLLLRHDVYILLPMILSKMFIQYVKDLPIFARNDQQNPINSQQAITNLNIDDIYKLVAIRKNLP